MLVKILRIVLVSLVISAGLGFGLSKAFSYAISFETAEPIDFTTAARKNAHLRFSLRWSLGRRSQLGWHLYVPLIGHAINSESQPNSVEFAQQISKWQKKRRLRTDGVVNRKTLYSFIKYWQSRRLRPIVLAKEYQLLTAPIADFYDPTRNVELLKVEKRSYLAYKKMIEAANKDIGKNENRKTSQNEKFLKIVSSYRSPKYQASLRKKQPGASGAQIAFRSPHFTGRALDIYVGGEPVTTKDFNRAIQIKTPEYKWLVKNAEEFGFYPYFYEPWHWEYVGKKVIK